MHGLSCQKWRCFPQVLLLGTRTKARRPQEGFACWPPSAQQPWWRDSAPWCCLGDTVFLSVSWCIAEAAPVSVSQAISKIAFLSLPLCGFCLVMISFQSFLIGLMSLLEQSKAEWDSLELHENSFHPCLLASVHQRTPRQVPCGVQLGWAFLDAGWTWALTQWMNGS